MSGIAEKKGIYPIKLQINSEGKSASQNFTLIVRGKNLATDANKIIANVMTTDTGVRDEMWLTVARSLYTTSVEVINDGRRLGNGSTFYSISNDLNKKVDYYGYE